MQIDAKDGRQREIGERKHRAPLPRSFSLSLSLSRAFKARNRPSPLHRDDACDVPEIVGRVDAACQHQRIQLRNAAETVPLSLQRSTEIDQLSHTLLNHVTSRSRRLDSETKIRKTTSQSVIVSPCGHVRGGSSARNARARGCIPNISAREGSRNTLGGSIRGTAQEDFPVKAYK